MQRSKKRRRVLLAVFAAALAAGAAGRKRLLADPSEAPIVGTGEEMRDAVASLPPVVPPAVVAPSRVAVWASPALRRREAEKILLSRRLSRVSRAMDEKSAELSRRAGAVR